MGRKKIASTLLDAGVNVSVTNKVGALRIEYIG